MIWDEKGRLEFAEWIRSIRRKYGLSQKKLGKKIYHFEYRGKKEICLSFHRNSVGNWENGKNLPMTVETFVSLALVDYCGTCDKPDLIRFPEMKRRYVYVRNCLQNYLGRSLYVRNINDALLIAAARGLYSIEELPEARQKMNEIIENVEVSLVERKSLSLERKTTALENEFLWIESREGFRSFVEENKTYFRIGNRTVGERAVHIFENPVKETVRRLKFRQMVDVYAPQYSVSYNKIFSSDFAVSRSWLISFCVKMRYTRSEINQILKNASMLSLSNQKESMEYYIRGEKNAAVGSVKWYEKMVSHNAPELSMKYQEAFNLPHSKKIAFLVLIICALIWDREEITFFPVDYLLEYFLLADEGQEALDIAEEEFSQMGKKLLENLSRTVGLYREYICDVLNMYTERFHSEVEKEALKAYADEFPRYSKFSEHKIDKKNRENKTARETARRLRFFAACSYSVLTGRIYVGSIKEEDLISLRCILRDGIGKKKEAENCINFFSLLWGMFLNNEEILWDGRGGFSVSHGRERSNVLSLREVLEDVIETYVLKTECTK